MGVLSKKPKMLLVELNEFDPEFLLASSKSLDLRNIPRALGLRRTSTTTSDSVEHQGLDPWVQWVSVHCGQPSAVHGVKRLGQTARQTLPQLWTRLGDAGVTWGAWGAMNAPRQSAPGCKFFFPDPWSFQEEAYPSSLDDLLALPRYAARNYLDTDRFRMALEATKFIGALVKPSMWRSAANFTRRFVAHAVTRGVTVHTLSTFLDYLSTLIFVDFRERMRPDFSLIFLNNIAHLQHQFWPRGSLHPEMILGLRLTDEMLGLLLDSLDGDEAFILMNGLKQRNVDGEGFCVYRQKNPHEFIKRLGLQGRVEQCMTHDAHIICDDAAAADRAERVLKGCRLSTGVRAFFVERVDRETVFYQIDFDREMPADTQLVSGNEIIMLSDVIDLYARRTGAHIPTADLFSLRIGAPAQIRNHEVFDLVLSHFGVGAEKAPLSVSTAR